MSFVCFVVPNAFAAAELRIGTDTNAPGGIAYLPVRLTTDTNIVAVQFDLVCPDTNWAFGDFINEHPLANHTVQTNFIAPGVLRVLITSPTNGVLRNGTLIYLPVLIPTNAPDTNLVITPANAVVASYEGNAMVPVSLAPGSVMVNQSYQPAAPAIVMQPPQNQVAGTGGDITLEVQASGSSILRYQWLRNSGTIHGATNAWLNLTNLALADAGNYKVIVANGYGAATSRLAQLTVNVAPVVAWQQSFGGSGDDQLRSLVPTSDGGFLLCGTSSSGFSGNKTNAGFGGADFWLVRVDDLGNKLWERSFGGIGDELLSSAIGTGDGGFLLGGWSDSGVSGNKTSPNYGTNDFWVIKVDAGGNKVWENAFGGAGDDRLYRLVASGDEGYLLAGGSSSSPSGNKTSEGFGLADIWLIKINAAGNKLWEKTYGGSSPDIAYGLALAWDGNYLLAGQSIGGPSGSKTSTNYGGSDFWILNVDAASGTKLWEQPYGGDGDDVAVDMTINLDGGFLVGGGSASGISGNKAGAGYGGNDYWILNFSPDGYEMWQQSFGGSGEDFLRSVDVASDGGFFLGGDSASGVSGNKTTPNCGANDFWLLKVDGDGKKEWEQVFGGSGDDQLCQIKLTAEGGMLLGGASQSGVSGNKTATNYGGADYWVVRLAPPRPAVLIQPAHKLMLAGANDSLAVVASGAIPLFYQWHKSVVSNQWSVVSGATNASFNLPSVALTDAGNYYCVVTNAFGSVTSQVALLSVAAAINQAPLVSVTAPTNGAVVAPGANLEIFVSAADTDGSVTRVEIFAGTNLLGTVTNVPYTLVWSNVAVGVYALTAQAYDNLGSNAVSALVTINVLLPSGPAAFQLSQALYAVSEAGTQAVVRVIKTTGGSGSVNYATREGTAKVVNHEGFGDFLSASGSLVFAPLDTEKTIVIPLLNDLGAEGDQDFFLELSTTGDGSTLGSPSTAIIRIIDDEPPPGVGSALEIRTPAAWPALGRVRMHLEPPSAEAQWRFRWETEWRVNDAEATGLEPGDYTVDFKAVSGSIPPAPDTFTLAAGATVIHTNYYIAAGQPVTGSLLVTLQPLGGRWRFQGQLTWQNSGVVANAIPEGEHVLEFELVSGRVTPASARVMVAGGQITSLSVYYPPVQNWGTSTPAEPTTVNISSLQAQQNPYACLGQLWTQAGYSSGYVVKERVVLTAGHALFNEASLCFANQALWFFQRHKAEHEPLPQAARGWYIYGGYAAARSNSPPGQSSVDTYNLDVAAVYFLQPAGRGGYGGCLVSDPSKNWLTGPENKLLAGYPVSGKDGLQAGKLYATVSAPFSFDLVQDAVYGSPNFRSYPGNSGGPLCVLNTNGYYYPAAIYLGESGPKSIVRIIDTNVVELLNRADLSANTGDNNTGGGVVLLTPGAGGGLFAPGYLQVVLGPQTALNAGAGWRLAGHPLPDFYNNNAALYGLLAGGYTVEFKPVSGFQTPTNRSVQIISGQTAVINGDYVVFGPGIVASLRSTNGVFAFGLTGQPGKVYVMEASTNLGQTNWTIIATNNMGSNGVWNFSDSASTNLPSRYYRAREK